MGCGSKMSEKPFCPKCDSARIARRNNKPPGKEDGIKWNCKNCSTLFDDPIYREPKTDHNHAGNKGLAKRLADAEPEDVSAE